MPDNAITVDEILKTAQDYDHEAHMALRRAQSVNLGEHASVCFESRQTALGFLQSLIGLEGLSCPVSLGAECDEAASLWQLPQGTLHATLTLHPKAHTTPAELCARLRAPVESLRLEVSGHICPIVLEGPLTPRVAGLVHLPEAAQTALQAPDARVELRWTGASPECARVPESVWRAWAERWAP